MTCARERVVLLLGLGLASLEAETVLSPPCNERVDTLSVALISRIRKTKSDTNKHGIFIKEDDNDWLSNYVAI